MKHKTLILGFILFLVGVVVASYQVQAQKAGPLAPQDSVSSAFTYQGQLLDNGAPVNATCDFRFNLYDDAWASPSLVAGPVDRGSVTVSDGYFSTAIDFGANAFTGEGRQLEIAVRCPSGSGDYTTLTGMVMLNATPYALSLRPGAIINGNATSLNGAILNVNNTYDDMFASYGIQATSNDIALLGAGGNTGVKGEAASNSGKGIYGEATSSEGGHGGYFVGYTGVYGKGTGAMGPGVRGESLHDPGGYFTSTNDVGVFGRSENSWGIYGYAAGDAGATYGIYGRNDSASGRGVYGWTAASSGSTYGVYGKSDSPGGTGVYGTAPVSGTVGIATDNSGTTYGVYGRADSLSGKGVYGEGGFFGVHGRGMDPTGTSYGVYGQTESTGISSYGGYFRNDNNVGLYAEGQDAGSRTAGDIRLAGAWGVIAADDNSDSSISLLSNHHVVVYLDNDESDAISCFSIYDPSFSAIVPFWEVCPMDAAASIVDTEKYGAQKLYAMESTEVWFEDFGSGALVNGAATVGIDPIFAETVDLNEYHIFLTPLGDCNGLYVAAKTAASFEVRELGGGASNVSFDYRLIAHRLGYEEAQ